MPLKTGIRFALQELIKLRPREGFPGLVDYITRHNERYWRVYKYYTPGRQTYVLVAEGVHAGCAAGTLFWRPYAGRWQRRPEIIKHLDGTWGVNGRVYSARKYLGIIVPSGCYSGITEGGERIINGKRL